MVLGNLFQGLASNLVELSAHELTSEFSRYLLPDETIVKGFKLIRDLIIFTDIRMIFVDKQGATGRKTALTSVFLMSIVDVEMETAGSGIDDSQITISYLDNVYLQSKNEVRKTLLLEFPKNDDIAPLYTYLFGLAYQNRLDINGK